MSNEDFQKLMISKLDKLDAIEESIKGIKTQLDENTQIVRSLIDKAEVNKADHDRMEHDLTYIQGDIMKLLKDTASIKDVLNLVEQVTAQNWVDISKIKKAK